MAGLLHPQRVDLPRGERAQVKPSAAVGDAPLFRNAGGFGDGKHQRIRAGETLLGEYDICAAADAEKMDFGAAFGLLWDALTGQNA